MFFVCQGNKHQTSYRQTEIVDIIMIKPFSRGDTHACISDIINNVDGEYIVAH